MDGVSEQIYTPEHDESSSKVYQRCIYCGWQTDGEWFENDDDGWPITPDRQEESE